MEALQISKRRRKLLARIYICHRKRGLGCTASTSTRMSMPRLPSKLCTCGDITTSKQQMCINCHIRTSLTKEKKSFGDIGLGETHTCSMYLPSVRITSGKLRMIK
ncbi:hypothetical protein G6F70_009363 [Rhizopus microsporus]|nr:hypothetical protein G6F71_005089 [Rhizopus microsporus]KAG1190917.1 hypothetical protein G6F70_009363 [Rhizopus microsporus]KAG1205649.1 hypothetical protein G6F69_009331 [Rhizopus microsporus]KAG1225070.1 hypothetical protein G6F67_009387 [Rhizopus microsporus]KAG1254504.1 hypothetical protein G6F68_010818 [Rhizopus microsporus]